MKKLSGVIILLVILSVSFQAELIQGVEEGNTGRYTDTGIKDSKSNSNSVMTQQTGSSFPFYYNMTTNTTYSKELIPDTYFEYTSSKKFSADFALTSLEFEYFPSLSDLEAKLDEPNNGNLNSNYNKGLSLFSDGNITQGTKRLTFNKEISPNLTLDIEFDHINFTFSEDKFAVSYVKFVFSQFELTIALLYSERYKTISINSTGNVKLLSNTFSPRINLKEIAISLGETEPTYLEEIIWGVASEEVFTYDAKISKFSLSGHSDSANFIVNNQPNQLHMNNFQTSNKINELIISPSSEVKKSTIVVIIMEYDSIETEATLNLRHNIPILQTTMEFYYIENNQNIVLMIPNDSQIRDIDSFGNYLVVPGKIVFYRDDLLIDFVTIQLILLFNPNEKIEWSEPLQNNRFIINSSNQILNYALLVSPINQILYSLNSLNNLFFDIPKTWASGNSLLITRSNGTWYLNSVSFNFTYPILFEENGISSSPGISTYHQLILINHSNDALWVPKNFSYVLNGISYKNQLNGTMVIGPNLAPGSYNIAINVYDQYVINDTINVTLIIHDFDPNLEVEIERIDIDKLILYMEIEEFDRWEVASTLNIQTNGRTINESLENSHFEVFIEDSQLNQEDEILTLLIILDQIATIQIIVPVPDFVEDENEDRSLVMIVVILVAALPANYFGIKYLKNTYFQKSLNF